MKKRVRILCQKGLLLKSSFLFLSISAMPALAIGGNTLKIDNTDEVVVLQKGKTIRGTVEDALGPITGANVVIKGSTIGVILTVGLFWRMFRAMPSCRFLSWDMSLKR